MSLCVVRQAKSGSARNSGDQGAVRHAAVRNTGNMGDWENEKTISVSSFFSLLKMEEFTEEKATRT